MSVSYFQVMYKKNLDSYQVVENTPNAGLYKLNVLAQCEFFQQFIENKYGSRTYNFAGNENLVKKGGNHP